MLTSKIYPESNMTEHGGKTPYDVLLVDKCVKLFWLPKSSMKEKGLRTSVLRDIDKLFCSAYEPMMKTQMFSLICLILL